MQIMRIPSIPFKRCPIPPTPPKEGTIRLISTYNLDAITKVHNYFDTFRNAAKGSSDYREIELFEGKQKDGSTLFGVKVPEKLEDIGAGIGEWTAGLKEMFFSRMEYDLIENTTEELQDIALAYKRPVLHKKKA